MCLGLELFQNIYPELISESEKIYSEINSLKGVCVILNNSHSKQIGTNLVALQ